ncbi:MAG: hypothetical protein ACRYFS_01045 [Janthinobacterium lividum]
MHHPVLGIIFYVMMGVFVVAAAYGVVAPMVDKSLPAKIGLLAAIWIAILLVVPIAEAFLDSFMQDKKITYLSQLIREWPLCILLLGGMFISLLRRWRKQPI